MPTTIDILRVRRILGRDEWLPPSPYGPDGWWIADKARARLILITVSEHPGWKGEWIHASIATTEQGTLPSYDDMALLHRAVFGNRYAYQVFAPPSQHVNICESALHLWGRLDGKPCMPEFGEYGSI